jgi:hypothetical protein
MMMKRFSASLLLPAALCGAVAFYFVANPAKSSPPVAASADPATMIAPPAETQTGALPPNHPPIGGMSPHGSHGTGGMMPSADNQEPAAITWTAPPSWQGMPNPTAMRLATYNAGGGAELSVARARGTVDANVDRWSAQFDGSPAAERTEKQVRGIKVTVAHVSGTFLGGGMSTTTPEKKEGWAMLAAIVES